MAVKNLIGRPSAIWLPAIPESSPDRRCEHDPRGNAATLITWSFNSGPFYGGRAWHYSRDAAYSFGRARNVTRAANSALPAQHQRPDDCDHPTAARATLASR